MPRFFDGFDARFAAAPHEVVFRIAGCDFWCRTSDPSYARILHQAFRLNSAADNPSVRILVETRGPFWPVWTDAFFREREVEARLEGGPFRFHYYDQADFWQIFQRETVRGIQLMTRAGAYPEWDPGSPLRNHIHWALIERGAALVHAGTLAVDGQGVLLAGAGGSGKSGTVLSGLVNGLNSVGDDYVAVTTEGGLRAHLVFNGLKQDPAGFARIGLAARMDGRAALNWQGKHVFTMHDLGLPDQPEAISVRALCLPRVAHAAQTTFTPVSAREAFLALAPSSVTQIPSARAESFRMSATVAREMPAYRVDLGTDPSEIADAFAGFIGGQGGC
ncbi:hypothetical protein [Sedimentimonas flavescens]|uniref:hypothetical protein n=1 Tax=Sedimentimonas flavescens TaxID=2851012 RepID=UPI001C4A4CFE|nr:hypothetical protein [Sedimentimonas flavescens]MBW0159688.1 hypothetical protein [Sedimentimonas flavescens]